MNLVKNEALTACPDWFFEAQELLAKEKGITYMKICSVLRQKGYKTAKGTDLTINTIASYMARQKKKEYTTRFLERQKSCFNG